MAKLKGLGRGLDALLSGSDDAADRQSLRSLDLDRIVPGKYQPRTRMDESSLAELAESIRAQGVVQPILVRSLDGGRFEIIAGERRWRAAQRAGLMQVPAVVRDVADQAALALSLIENIQREDLNPLEEAQGIARLIGDFGLTHESAAQAVGRSRSAVSNLLRLMQLAKPVQELLLAGKLDMGHARALLSLPVSRQQAAAGRIVAQALSVRETERMVHALQVPSQAPVKRGARQPADADVARLENALADALGAKVRIEPGKKSGGRIVIDYSSLDHLDGILLKLKPNRP
ncbi:MAG: ParB/RepB/Spo0J family partition protein [Betaproteobacteria bacterium]|nr:MAG: ParB/RepB/Spo0J family partition protein [Betaproteobacteria bacterium]